MMTLTTFRIGLPAIGLLIACSSLPADDGQSILEPAEDQETHLLRYDLQPGDRIDYEVTHIAKTKTTVNKNDETTNVHTISRRHWEIVDRLDNDDMVFEHVVDSVEMTQQQGDKPEIRWESGSGEDPPAVFKIVAAQIGKKLATVTVNARGEEIDRVTHDGSEAKLGMGALTMLLPEKAIAIGQTWSVPREVKVRLDNGQVKTVKIREQFTLQKVKTGVATISLKSQPLTPLNEPSVEAQVLQQLSNGTIRFDVDNGRMMEKQLNWDERVVGFQGPTSLLEYRARMTETLVDTPTRTARLSKDD